MDPPNTDDSTSPSTRHKEVRKDFEDWTPHRSSVQALKQAKIVQSTVPVVEGLSYAEWLEQSGLAHTEFQTGASPPSSQTTRTPKVPRDTDDPAVLFARLENESIRRQELELRLESLRKHHDKERKMLLEQAKAGHSALQEAIRLEKSLDSRKSDGAAAQLRTQLASARALADSRTQEVQQLLLVV